jgi:hypothetical protein
MFFDPRIRSEKMADEKELSHEEWLAEERARLEKGFAFEPQPSSAASEPGPADEVLAGLGLGAGAVAGAVAPHPNPVTFEGTKAAVIVNALRKEIPDDDTRVQVEQTGDALVVTILQSQENRPQQFFPAVTATLIETPERLTVTVSELDQDTVRGAVSSMGSTLLDQGKRALLARRRGGVAGLLDTVGRVKEGVEDLVEDIQDLSLPRRVWRVIDRVGGAAEQAYLDKQRREQELQWQREAAERAWTHCEWCGRAYKDDEDNMPYCPACGAPRGERPASLK